MSDSTHIMYLVAINEGTLCQMYPSEIVPLMNQGLNLDIRIKPVSTERTTEMRTGADEIKRESSPFGIHIHRWGRNDEKSNVTSLYPQNFSDFVQDASAAIDRACREMRADKEATEIHVVSEYRGKRSEVHIRWEMGILTQHSIDMH